MSRDDLEFEQQLRERLRDLALDVSPTEQLLETSRTRARQAAARHRARRLLVPAAAAIVVIAAIAAALVVSSQEPTTHVRPAEPPPTSVKVVPPTTTTSPTTTPPTQPPPADPLAGLPDVDVVITPEQRTEGELVYEVPTFRVTIDGKHSAAAEAIEADLAATVDGLVAYSLHLDEQRRIADFEITALVDGVTDRSVSIRIDAYMYYEGAAHGGRRPAARTYDAETGRVMTLDELFQPGGSYLPVVAGLASERLVPVLEAFGGLTIGTGTEPTAENYDVWAALPEGLEITFKEYQVGPYAIGQPAVVIPWDQLASVLGPWQPHGLAAPWAGGVTAFADDIDDLRKTADAQFATATELRSVRRVGGHQPPYHSYIVGLVVMPNHTVTPMAIRVDGDEPATVVALGTNRFGCDTLPAEVIAQLFLPCG